MVQRGLVEIAPPASSAAVPGAAGLSTSARPSATGPLPMTGITPWASGSAGRLLFLEVLFLRAERRTNLPLLFEDPRSGPDSTPLWTGFTRWGAVHSSLSPTAMAAIARA
jgi:hypothetical protein